MGSPKSSKTLILPPFSATKMRPSAAKRTAVGLVSPLRAIVSWKPSGTSAAAALSWAEAPVSATESKSADAAAGRPRSIASATAKAGPAPRLRALQRPAMHRIYGGTPLTYHCPSVQWAVC